VHFPLLPASWRFRAWWDPEVYALAAGLHLWFISLLSGQYPNKFNWLSSMTYAELLAV
jgi:hypothetical protein